MLEKEGRRDLENSSVPSYFRNIDRFSRIDTRAKIDLDDVTGIPLESDWLRNYLVLALSSTAMSGGQWACLYVDTDHLKKANAISHKVGNKYLRAAASRMTSIFNLEQFTGRPEIVALRKKSTGDELAMWFFGISSNEVENIERRRQQLEAVIHVGEEGFEGSVSSYLISSRNPGSLNLKLHIVQTRAWLLENPQRRAYDLYEEIYEEAEKKVQKQKGRKQWKRLHEIYPKTTTTLDEFINAVAKELGGGRVDENLLIELSHIIALLEFRSRPDARERAHRLGVSPRRLFSAWTSFEVERLYRELHPEAP